MKNKLPVMTFILFGAIFLVLLVFGILDGFELEGTLLLLAYLSVPAALTLVAEIIGIIIRLKKNKPYADNIAVLIVNVLMLLVLVPYAIYDITVNSGMFFGGLLGVLILIFLVPVNAASLVIDLVVFLVRRKKLRNAESDITDT